MKTGLFKNPCVLPIQLVGLIAFLMLTLQSNGIAEVCKGRVQIQGGGDLSKVQLLIHESPMSMNEGSWNVVSSQTINEDGTFQIEYEPSESTQLEFTGPNVVRKRFPFPTNPDTVAVFPLQGGTFAKGKLVDENGAGIPDAFLGPITVIPNTDDPKATSPIGPFFTSTDSSGNFEVTGLPFGFRYKIPVYAEGFQRKSLVMVQKQELTESLVAGGSTASGAIRGELTQKPMPGETIHVIGSQIGIDVRITSDENSEFEISGLPRGEYKFIHLSKDFGYNNITNISVDGKTPVEGISVTAYEGTNLYGNLIDRETSEPIVGAVISAGDFSSTTNDLGAFEINAYTGAFPVRFELDHPDFLFYDKHQDREQYPIQFAKSRGLSVVQLKAQKRRVLEIKTQLPDDLESAEVQSEAEGSQYAFLQLAPIESIEKKLIKRIDMPYDSILLEDKGSYQAFLYSQNIVSNIVEFETEEKTTTTVSLETGPTPIIDGVVFYEVTSANQDLDYASGYEVSLRKNGAELFQAISNELGEFKFQKIPASEFELRVQNESEQILYSKNIQTEFGESMEIGIPIEKGILIEGVVKNLEDEPIHNATVAVYGQTKRGETVNLNTTSKHPNGKFSFDEISISSLNDIIIKHPDYKTKYVKPTLDEASSLEIILENKNGIVVNIDAPEWARTVGKVYLLRGSNQTFGSGISQEIFNAESMKNVDGENTLTLIPKLDGSYRVALQVNDQWDVSEKISWGQDNGSDASVTLTENASAELEVTWDAVSEDDLALLEVELINTSLPENLYQIDPSQNNPTKIGVTYLSIPPGEYIFTAYLPNGSVETLTGINLEANSSEKLSISISEEPKEVAGFVLFEQDESLPVINAKISFRFSGDIGSEPMIETTTDQDGFYTAYPVLSGYNYQVEIDTGSQKEYYRVTLDNSSEKEIIEKNFSIPLLENVQFQISDTIRNEIQSLPVDNKLILFSTSTRKSYMLDASDSSASMQMAAGKYQVFAAEEQIGEFEVRVTDSEEPQTITLKVGS